MSKFLQQTKSLTASQSIQYKEKGFLILPKLFSQNEVEEWRVECNRLSSLDIVNPFNLRSDFRDIDGEMILERFDPVIDLSPLFAKLVEDSRLKMPVADILGDSPQLFKDKIIFKFPGADGYPMHQDAAWWQRFPINDILTIAIAIDNSDSKSGAMEFFPGYHSLLSKVGEIRHMTPGERSQVDHSRRISINLNSGDAVLMSTFLPHQSGRNCSDHSRSILFFTYAAARHGNLYPKCLNTYQKYARIGDNRDQGKYFFK